MVPCVWFRIGIGLQLGVQSWLQIIERSPYHRIAVHGDHELRYEGQHAVRGIHLWVFCSVLIEANYATDHRNVLSEMFRVSANAEALLLHDAARFYAYAGPTSKVKMQQWKIRGFEDFPFPYLFCVIRQALLWCLRKASKAKKTVLIAGAEK